MSQLDYQPRSGGKPVDPEPAGGTVSTLELYDQDDRSGAPAATSGPPELVRTGWYRFSIDDTTTPPGRYWARVLWTETAAGPTVTDDLFEPVDLPVRPDLVMSPEDLAVRLGIPLPLTPQQRNGLTVALVDAQDDVVAYLGRPILPQIFTERRAWPYGGGVEYLSEQPVWEVLSETEEAAEGSPTGYWMVTYTAGLHARADTRLRPILRAVRTAAANHDIALGLWATVGAGAATNGTGAKQITSLSAEGQSVGYSMVRPGGAPGGGSSSGGGGGDGYGLIGAPVPWSSIDRWRLRGRRVYQRPGPNRPGGWGGANVTVGL